MPLAAPTTQENYILRKKNNLLKLNNALMVTGRTNRYVIKIKNHFNQANHSLDNFKIANVIKI